MAKMDENQIITAATELLDTKGKSSLTGLDVLKAAQANGIPGILEAAKNHSAMTLDKDVKRPRLCVTVKKLEQVLDSGLLNKTQTAEIEALKMAMFQIENESTGTGGPRGKSAPVPGESRVYSISSKHKTSPIDLSCLKGIDKAPVGKGTKGLKITYGDDSIVISLNK